MQALSEIHKDILLRCSDDEVGLWEVVQVVTWYLVDRQTDSRELLNAVALGTWTTEQAAELGKRERALDPNLVREEVLHVIHDLLEARLIHAGFPGNHGKWEPWNFSPAETMRRIEAEWDVLGHPPNIGDIVWFISTIEGDRVLSQGEERNAASEG